ncbi:hypothetical protein BUALT_Bualt03G0103800 [Buddleja alternifolia]|uniref:Transcription factor CBF/NF-Y/archaeal histone domain-containing protein n=1 Tax=Buddleja alternifolia TaxID=168488 RepID=A0AAV6Y3E4_9LAMI|nr:hypothetical protein BUALT_Bualt03G0103800 [Buddleja alternifolia]
MRHVLPANAKINDDVKETIQECVSEFISFITSEANERLSLIYQPEAQMARPPPMMGYKPVLSDAYTSCYSNYAGLPQIELTFLSHMHHVLRANAKIDDDAKETFQKCVSEFISFITSEANKRCHGDYRKTITPEDVLSAMRTLGFNDYIEPLTIFLNTYQSKNPDRIAIHQMSFKRRSSLIYHPEAQMARQPPMMGYKSVLSNAYTSRYSNYVGLPQIVIKEPTKTTNTQTDANNLSNLPEQSFKRDTDQYMPLVRVTRIMCHVLPAHAKIADDAKEAIQECVSEFISFITSEANQRCHQEYRKTISSEDIISVMGILGRSESLAHQPEAHVARPPPPTMSYAPALPNASSVVQ